MRKIIIVLSLAVFLFAGSMLQVKKTADAAVWLAAPVLVEVGIYTTAIVAATLAANEGANFVEHYNQNRESYKKVWNGLSTAAKDSFINAYNTAVNSGSPVMEITDTFINGLNEFAGLLVPQYSDPVDTVAGGNATRTFAQDSHVTYTPNTGYNFYDGLGYGLGQVYITVASGSATFGGVEGRYKYVIRTSNGTLAYISENAPNINYETFSMSALISYLYLYSQDTAASFNKKKYSISLKKESDVAKTDSYYWHTVLNQKMPKDPQDDKRKIPLPDIGLFPIGDGGLMEDMPLDFNGQDYLLENGDIYTGPVGTKPPVLTQQPDGKISVPLPDGSQSDPTTGEVVVPAPDPNAEPEPTEKPEGSSWWEWLLKPIIGAINLIKSAIDGLVNIVTGLAKAIADAIGAIFVPSDGFFDGFFKEIKTTWDSKIPIIGQLNQFLSTVENSSTNGAKPVIEVNLPPQYGGVKISVIDLSYFDQYRDWIFNFIRFTAWFYFLRKLYSRIPRIIGG